MAASTDRLDYRLTFAVLAVGACAFSLMQSMVSPVLPLLEHDLHTSQNTVTWVLTAYLLAASVATPILGRIGDMIGKEKVLVVVLLVVTVGAVMAALANSIAMMIAARAVQGVGGGIIPLSFGIIRDEFPRDKIASAVGTIAALLAVGGGLGLVLAGPVVSSLDVHWLFWIPGIATLIGAIAAYFFVPESPIRTPGRVNILAATLLSGWLIALLVAVSEAPTWGWASGTVWLLIVGSVVLAVAWIVVEVKSEHPLIDMRMMRLHAVWTTNVVAFLFGAGMYSMFAFLPEFLQTPKGAGYGFNASITESGLISFPQTVAMFIFGIASGPLSKRFGAKAVLVAGAAASIIPFMVLAYAHAHVWTVTLGLTLMGLAFGLGYSAMSNIIVDGVPSHQTGVASGMNANIRTIGGSIGAAVVASVITAHSMPDGLPHESGYTHGFALLGVVMIVTTLAAFLIPRITPNRDAHQIEQAQLSHPELAIIAGGTLVGDEPE